jgi:hypothetical protein
VAAAAVAVAGFLAAGSASASARTAGSVPGSIGSAPPAAAGPETAGTITVAEWATDTPTWIFPVIPAADNATGNLTLFTEQMWLWAWKDTVSGPPASFENLTQYAATPEFWYLTG